MTEGSNAFSANLDVEDDVIDLGGIATALVSLTEGTDEELGEHYEGLHYLALQLSKVHKRIAAAYYERDRPPVGQRTASAGKLNLRAPATEQAPGEALIDRLRRKLASYRQTKPDQPTDEELDKWAEEHDRLEEQIIKAEADTLEHVAVKLDVLVDRLLGETGPRGNCFDYIGAASARDDLRRLIAAKGE